MPQEHAELILDVSPDERRAAVAVCQHLIYARAAPAPEHGSRVHLSEDRSGLGRAPRSAARIRTREDARKATEEQMLRAKVWYFSQEVKKSREYVDRVRETEIALQNLLQIYNNQSLISIQPL